jgi:hypothetical protein
MNRDDQAQSVAKPSKARTQARELLGGGFNRSGTRKRSTVQELRTAQKAKEGESYYSGSRVLI